MSDINETLREAPQVDLPGNVKGRPNSLGQRLKQKVKKHTPFSKKKRDEAEYKDKIFKTAKELKNQFAQHMQNYPDGTTPTVAHLEEFFKDSEYEQYVAQVAKDLGFRGKPAAKGKGEPTDTSKEDPKTDPAASTVPKNAKDDSNDTAKVDAVDPTQDQEDMVSPEELQDKKEESKDESVDMSASIYESRLRKMLFELKDNEIDTILVRVIQAQNRAKGGPATPGMAAVTGDDRATTGSKASKSSKSSDSSVSDDEITRIKEQIDRLGEDILAVIRNQKNIDDVTKKTMANEIHTLVVDMVYNSF